jgi:hypothetical protein
LQQLDYQLSGKGDAGTYSVTVWTDPKAGLSAKRLLMMEGGPGSKVMVAET